MIIEVKSPEEMIILGQTLGAAVTGGEVIELVGDVGAGKTTLTKGIALGLGIDDAIQSPTFTISRVYPARDNLMLVHYDFYRLNNAGLMTAELDESVRDKAIVTVVEWGDVVMGVLPASRIRMTIETITENSRRIAIEAPDSNLIETLNDMRKTQ